MAAIADLTEAEKCLVALMQDQSGIDLAEFVWTDETAKDNIFRCWDFQYPLYRNESKYQIDLCGRSLGKSNGIQMRAFAFPFTSAGEEMLITAPEMIHLDPVTKKIEDRITSVRIGREYLKTGAGVTGFTHRPFEARFRNGARVIGRIPQKDGRGVKGSVFCGPPASDVNPVSVLADDQTMILTPSGLTPAASLSTGDLVYTHRGRFRPIEHIYRYEADAVEVSGAGHRGLLCSTNHRFWARRNSNPQRTRNLGTPTWIIVDDPEITKRWYWASPSTFPTLSSAEELDLPNPQRTEHWVDHFGKARVNHVVTEMTLEMAPVLLFMAGCYLADGHLDWGGRRREAPTAVGFTDDEKGILQIEAMAELLGYQAHRRKHENAVSTGISNAELARWLYRHFGHMSDGKRVPGWMLGVSTAYRRSLLDGYLAGDGHYNTERDRWEFGSASKQLALGLKLLAQSLGYGTSFSWVDPKVTVIGGVELKAAPKRSYRVQLIDDGNGIFEDGFLWGKIRKVTPVGMREVLDIVVAEDHSYVGDGIVHKGSGFLPDDDEVW